MELNTNRKLSETLESAVNLWTDNLVGYDDWSFEHVNVNVIGYLELNQNAHKVKGDVNADGEFNVADIVALQNWLLAKPGSELADWQAGDLCEDGRIDAFDMVQMKKLLISL